MDPSDPTTTPHHLDRYAAEVDAWRKEAVRLRRHRNAQHKARNLARTGGR